MNEHNFSIMSCMRGGLMTIMGEGSCGKSMFSLDYALHAARSGHPVAFYSAQEGAHDLIDRVMAVTTGINPVNIHLNKLTLEERALCHKEALLLYGLPLYFEDAKSIRQITFSIRRLYRKKNIEIVFVDFLQLIPREEGVDENQYNNEVLKGLKNLAKELNICIILVTQEREVLWTSEIKHD